MTGLCPSSQRSSAQSGGALSARVFCRPRTLAALRAFSLLPACRKIHRAAGFSLSELLIALALSALLAAGLLQAAGVALRTSWLLREDAFLQGNARFARALLVRELAQAGYGPCRGLDAPFENMVAATPGYAWLFGAAPLIGYEQGEQDWPASFAEDALPGTDAVLLRRGLAEREALLAGHSTPQLLLAGAASLEEGEILLLADAGCRASVLFQLTGTGHQRLDYEASATVRPGNCDDCSPPLPWGTFAPGSAILPYRAVAYYIGSSAATGMPALFRERLVRRQGGLATRSEEVLQGVESMQLRYAVDTDDDAFGIPDRYQNAAEISAWSRVRGLEVDLLLRSRRPVASLQSGSDKFLRRRLRFFVFLSNGGR